MPKTINHNNLINILSDYPTGILIGDFIAKHSTWNRANKRIISIAGAYHDVILEELNRYDLTIHNNNFKDTYNCHHKRS
ncbi:hypothetical protein NPIL_3981 [Nephila pilipes]|uniref:Uncharacterized protein n=1 Tax=Nephila pilipes TaxID=299642 RepID=A0A8X6TGW5_NEPPI|nr:hypothetical protein NPIL_3981 [Nephila pilipes]